MDEEVEEGGQDVALPAPKQVPQAALLGRLLAALRQHQRVLQLLEDPPGHTSPPLTAVDAMHAGERPAP